MYNYLTSNKQKNKYQIQIIYINIQKKKYTDYK